MSATGETYEYSIIAMGGANTLSSCAPEQRRSNNNGGRYRQEGRLFYMEGMSSQYHLTS